MTYFMAGEGRRMFGQTVPAEMPDKCGDVACASRSASSAASRPGTSRWRSRPGRSCRRWSPATPSSSSRRATRRCWRAKLVEIFDEAGPAAGRRQHGLRLGRDRRRARSSSTPTCRSISFTGSNASRQQVDRGRRAAAQARARSSSAARTRSSCMDDADLDLAVDGILWSAFGTTGQRCTAASRVIVARAACTTSWLAKLRRARRGAAARRRPRPRRPTSARVINQASSTRSTATPSVGVGDEGAAHR